MNGYSRRILNYPKRIVLSFSTHMKIMIYVVAIGLETPRINSMYFLEKEFTKLKHMNRIMVLYININKIEWYSLSPNAMTIKLVD